MTKRVGVVQSIPVWASECRPNPRLRPARLHRSVQPSKLNPIRVRPVPNLGGEAHKQGCESADHLPTSLTAWPARWPIRASQPVLSPTIQTMSPSYHCLKIDETGPFTQHRSNSQYRAPVKIAVRILHTTPTGLCCRARVGRLRSASSEKPSSHAALSAIRGLI
jgi:hypothetical protein